MHTRTCCPPERREYLPVGTALERSWTSATASVVLAPGGRKKHKRPYRVKGLPSLKLILVRGTTCCGTPCGFGTGQLLDTRANTVVVPPSVQVCNPCSTLVNLESCPHVR